MIRHYVIHPTNCFLQSTNHQLTLNLYTLRVWCYECEIEVFPDSVIREVDEQQMMQRQRVVMEREVERVVQRDTKWELPPRSVIG